MHEDKLKPNDPQTKCVTNTVINKACKLLRKSHNFSIVNGFPMRSHTASCTMSRNEMRTTRSAYFLILVLLYFTGIVSGKYFCNITIVSYRIDLYCIIYYCCVVNVFDKAEIQNPCTLHSYVFFFKCLSS